MIVNSTLHVGGAEQVAANIAQHLDARTYDIGACFLKEGGVVGEQMLAAKVNLVPIPGLVAGRRDYFSSMKLRRLIRGRSVDIVHTHDMHGLMDAAVCRLTTPSLRHVHTFHFGNYPNRTPRYKAIERLLWRVPDALIAVGHVQAESIRRLYRIPEDRIRTIRNGVEPPRPGSRRVLPDSITASGDQIIVSVSTLIAQKGIESLIDAAALLQSSGEPFQLLIAGDGELRESLKERARTRGVANRVHFLGWIPNAADCLLPVCDIFVQSSLWEAMSVVVLEAMAAGKPMAVTDVGDNSGVVVDNESGLLVRPQDPVALAGKLRILVRSGDLRRRLGDAARSRYEKHFTTARMIEAHDDLYQELMS